MPKSPFSDVDGLQESWAEVRARDLVMRYRRSGVGRSVLLVLRPPHDTEPLWPELFETLGDRFRLIAPEPPANEADAARWLADFMEGLGASKVRILATGCFCIPVLELALHEADQIAALVLVAHGPGSGKREAGSGKREAGSGRLETAVRDAAVPLLVVRRGQPADEAVPLITGFLASG